jgi:hypothetical protein
MCGGQTRSRLQRRTPPYSGGAPIQSAEGTRPSGSRSAVLGSQAMLPAPTPEGALAWGLLCSPAPLPALAGSQP